MLKRTAGDLIRHARWAKNWTVRDLAEASGVSATTIVKVEKGGDMKWGQKVYALAAALDLEPNDLFTEEVAS